MCCSMFLKDIIAFFFLNLPDLKVLRYWESEVIFFKSSSEISGRLKITIKNLLHSDIYWKKTILTPLNGAKFLFIFLLLLLFLKHLRHSVAEIEM